MPPKGKGAKKGGRKKKKVLSAVEQERLRAEEAEKRCRELIMLQSRLREIVDEEREMSKVATSTIEARWIVFLRECKQKELVAQIEVLRRTFEATVDRKDAACKLLFGELEVAEDQCRHVFRSHIEVANSLMEVHSTNMKRLESQFEKDLLDMKRDFEVERREMQLKHKMELDDLQLILDNMASDAEMLEKKLQEDTSEGHETVAERMDEEKRQMEAELMKVEDTIRLELDTQYKDFMSTAQANMKDYMEKSKEDQETTEQISAQLKKIEKLQVSVASWRTNVARSGKEWEERNSAIDSERSATVGFLKALKAKMQAWRQRQAKDLVDLVKDANAAEETLQGTTKKAARLIRLVELCKPFETEREQVLSYESHISPAAIQLEAKRRVAMNEPGALDAGASAIDSATPAANEQWQLLDRFWMKHNKVVLDNTALTEERSVLEEENQKLQMILKQYLDDITVNDSVMQSRNTLLLTRAAGVPNVVQAAGTGDGAPLRSYNIVEGTKYVSDQARQAVSNQRLA